MTIKMKKMGLKSFILTASAVCVLFLALIFARDYKCGIVALCMSAGLLILFALFEISRIRFIEDINDYLSKVLQGDYSFDITDNFEGELSILKNNIYKVVVMLKSTNEELKKEKLNLAQSMADITHQLKTPLTSITVMTDLMENEQMQEKRAELLDIIKTQTDKMNWLTVTLLKLSRLDADAISFNFSAVSISDILDSSLKTFQSTLDLRNITVRKNITDFEFNGDSAWTAEAVKNIIKNCIEHTGIGGELILGSHITNIYNELVISDNGSGIDSEDLPHIFERFYHGKNASADSVGIGLNLAKEILSKQRAEITCESEIGKGSTFRIKFYKAII